MNDSFGSRVLARLAELNAPCPACRKLHSIDPSLRRDVSCCGKQWKPRRLIVGIELVNARGVA